MRQTMTWLFGMMLCIFSLTACAEVAEISGTVVDDAGAPIEGARVLMYRIWLDQAKPLRGRIEPVFTDAGGRWSARVQIDNVKSFSIGGPSSNDPNYPTGPVVASIRKEIEVSEIPRGVSDDPFNLGVLEASEFLPPK